MHGPYSHKNLVLDLNLGLSPAREDTHIKIPTKE